jgi:RNA polymerase sigma factor (sigma-70 family)
MHEFDKYESAYRLETEEGVEYFLNDYSKIAEARFYARDLSMSDMLLDFEFAMRKALTARQYEVISMTYKKDLIQQVVADRMGISQQTVNEHIRKAIKNLATYHMIQKKRMVEEE